VFGLNPTHFGDLSAAEWNVYLRRLDAMAAEAARSK